MVCSYMILNYIKIDLKKVSNNMTNIDDLKDEELEKVTSGLSYRQTSPENTCFHHTFKKGIDDTREICETCSHFKSPSRCNYVGPIC